MDRLSRTRLYSIFHGMKHRCYNPQNPAYKWYGGKGVTICSEWMGENGLELFTEWALNNGYEEHLTIDRIDSNDSYSPENCRWITRSENSSRANHQETHEKISFGKYVYPAIFTPEEEGGYSIRFPDVTNCFTDADTLDSAMERANDVLCLMLYELEQAGKEIPAASTVAQIQTQTEGDEFVSLIACDTLAYRRFYDNKAVKKTLSIPSWLNDMAERAGVNFSATLQEALKQQLRVN